MKYILIVFGLAAVCYWGFLQAKKGEQAAIETPPPEPPAVKMPPPQVLDEEQLNRVKTATMDLDPQVRWEALQLLVSSRDPRADEIMFQMLNRDGEPTIRRNIAGILAERRGPQVREALVAALKDMDGDVRLNALDSLGKQDDPEAIPAISDCLKDIDERIRLSALNILKNLQEKRNQEIREARERQENATRERAEKGSKKTEAK
jgi:hypothetical protein